MEYHINQDNLFYSREHIIQKNTLAQLLYSIVFNT